MFSPSVRRRRRERIAHLLVRSMVVLGVFLPAAGIAGALLAQGVGAVDFRFLTTFPGEGADSGGILPCILGTLILATGGLAVSLPLGLATAIFLSEYAPPGPLLTFFRSGVSVLSAIPSVVAGMFGLALFVVSFGFGVSILSGILTLGVLILPSTIVLAETALRSVDDAYRRASLSLGATKWQTISRIILPQAAPALFSSILFNFSRLAGETAAVMFTATVFFRPVLPSSLFDDVMILPYQVYVLATSGFGSGEEGGAAFGTALVLVALVGGITAAAAAVQKRVFKLQAR